MKPTAIVLSLAAVVFAIWAVAGDRAGSPNSQPLRLRNLDQYIKVTNEPFKMHDSTIAFCRAPEEIAINPHEPSHPTTAFCNVYVNARAKETMISGEGTYPEGSLVIKSKLENARDKTPILYTVMEKMAAGYDEKNGNWKYIVVDGASFRQMAAGRIDSCIACHVDYAATDFITRTYLAAEGRTNR